MSESNENYVVKEDIYVLAEEPLPGATPEMVREQRRTSTCQCLCGNI